MSEDGFAPDEWDPPALNRVLPFPPPILFEVSVRDSGPLLGFLLEGWQFYRGFRHDPWFQEWFLWAGLWLAVLWTINALIRPQGRRLLLWIPVLGRHFLLLLVSRMIWRPVPVRRIVGQLERRSPIDGRAGGAVGVKGSGEAASTRRAGELPGRNGLGTAASKKKTSWTEPVVSHVSKRIIDRVERAARLSPLARRGWFTIMLPRDIGRMLMANITVDEDGVLDTSGIVGPRWLRWAISRARAREHLVALLWLSDTGNLDLYDPEAREGVWAARQELFARPDHRMSLYLRVRPFPIAEIVRAAGPVGAEAAEWAKTLVQRRLLMAVPAARRSILEHRLMGLLGVSDDQPGRLGNAGMFGVRLGEEDVDDLGTDSWGVLFRPSLAISPRGLEVETGENDPDPIGMAPDQPEAGNPGVRRYRTYALTGLPSRLRVGWTEPLTGRRILCDLAIHLTPVADSWAEIVLGLKGAWWGGMTLGRAKYAQAAAQAARTLALVRRRESKVLSVGIYATVAETQTPTAELALVEMVGRENFMAPMFDQLAARVATEPTGRDPLGQTWWTDSQTIAAATMGGGGIWVPGCTLVGEAPRSNEPVGGNLWWEGDETSLLFVAGRSGSGKTNAEQAFAGRHLEPHPDHWLAKYPPPVIVAYMKPFDEWAGFCKRFNGKHYSLGPNWREVLGPKFCMAPMDAPVVAFNMSGIPLPQRGEFLEELEPWVIAHQARYRFRRPLLYIIGEAWAMKPGHLQQFALQVRALRIGLIVDTQYIDHLLSTEARDVVRSASMFLLMRLRTGERKVLEEMLDIGDAGMKFLAQIARPNTLTGGSAVVKGKGIFEAHGLRTTLQVKRFGFEIPLLNQTSPTLRDDDLDEELDALSLDESLDTESVLLHSGNGKQLAAGGRWKQ